MKETIYTIPINEAFDTKCSCAICAIENRIENEELEYTLGPAMMEPDFRINSNRTGFCKTHYNRLLQNGKALPMALVLQTHIEKQSKEIFLDKVKKISKNGFLKKKCDEIVSAKKITNHIESLNHSCIVCERTQDTMNRYFDNLIYIWKTQEDFRKKFASQDGFCIPHFSKLLTYAMDGLNEQEFKDFYHTIVNMQETTQNQLYNDISEFVMLFDHNNTNSNPSENVKNSIKNSVQNLSGLNCETD